MTALQKTFRGRCKHCNGDGQVTTIVDGASILSLTVQNMGNKIEAIKAVRTLYPVLGLKEAKDFVEYSIAYIENFTD